MHAPTDTFVTKLTANGRSLVFSTYIGGSGNDNGRAIHLARNGELVVGGGASASRDLPTTPGAYKRTTTTKKGGFVARLSVNGSQLRFLTYFGPNDTQGPGETLRSLGEDTAGNIWIGGSTKGKALTTTPDAFQPLHGGGSAECYIAKLSPDGKDLVYLSWLGGNRGEEIETEGVTDSDGNFYVVGGTGSSNFPVTANAYQKRPRGVHAGFVTKINEDGSLAFSTLFGGSAQNGSEGFFGPVIDKHRNVYAFGRFRSTDLPTTSDALPEGARQPGWHNLTAISPSSIQTARTCCSAPTSAAKRPRVLVTWPFTSQRAE